jgi:hypothetical protein
MILPVDRALSIYGALANRSETKGARERLSRHLMKMYIDGEKDEHRLTVHGLTYLRNLDREIDPETNVDWLEQYRSFSPYGHPAACAGNPVALFSLSRRGLPPSLLVVFSAAASSFALRPLALVSALSRRSRQVAFSLGRWALV